MDIVNKSTEKIKILFITSLLDKMGGAEKNICDIVLNIDRDKFTPYVLVFSGGELTDKLKNHGISVEINGISKLFSMFAMKKATKLYRFLKKERIRVVVTYHHDSDIWGGLIAKLAGVPVIISSRRDMGYQLEKIHVWFYRIFGFLFSSFISVSDAVKKEIENRERIKPEKIETIHNGIRMNIHPHTPNHKRIKVDLGIDPSKTIIGMLAAFRPIKGHQYLVEAIAKIVIKYQNIKILIVGYQKTEYFNVVKRKVEELKLQDYFIFTEHQQDISQLLSIFDILVVPSVNEGFSNAILEAMVMGIPIIASDGGGNPEAVEHQKTGLLFKACSSQSLADALEQLIEDKNLRQAMGKEGLKKVRRDFTLNQMIKENEDLYKYHLFKPNLKKLFIIWVENKKIYHVKKSIKIFLSYILYYSGICQIYKKVTKGNLKVLAYHSINKLSLRPLEIEQDPENFKQQMLFLKKHYHILSLSEFLQCMKNGQKYPDNSVLITFDDGYKDNYTNAYPILKKLKIPAVIFLATDPIEKNIPLFFDGLRYAILNTKRKILDLQDWGLKLYALYKNKLYLAEIICEITDYSKGLSRERQLELIAIIFERLEVDKETFLKPSPYLAWDEIREMSDNGIDFGAHTMSHPSLRSLSPEQVENELIKSKKLIEANTNKKVVSFAYPFGSSYDYSWIIPDILRENGFKCAFMLTRESNGLYRIGRKTVDSHMTTEFNGKFYKSLFECEMASIFS